jgi:cysteine desulfuration protein SufE
LSAAARLRRLAATFASAPREVRLQALRDYGRRLPEMPRDVQVSGRFEVVVGGDVPMAVAATHGLDGKVRVHVEVPAVSPLLRGYAGMLHDAVDGVAPEEILALPDDGWIGLLDVADLSDLGDTVEALVTTLKQQVAGLER